MVWSRKEGEEKLKSGIPGKLIGGRWSCWGERGMREEERLLGDLGGLDCDREECRWLFFLYCGVE